MTDFTQPYVTRCPVGCRPPLAPTTLLLPEGALRRCEECGQLLSRIGEAAYWESMRQFDQHEFNQPAPRELARRFKVARRRLATISALLGKSPAALRVLDVGCSRGNFLEAGAKLGFHIDHNLTGLRHQGHLTHRRRSTRGPKPRQADKKR